MESKWIKLYMKTEKLSAENKWQQTQFNEKMGKYGKSKLKNIVKYNILIILIQIDIYIEDKCHDYLGTWAK
jgi:hypothetical protein